jgi:hypothetical protein
MVIWGKNYAQFRPNYIPRMAFATQPGLTLWYLKYVCKQSVNPYPEDFSGIAASAHEFFNDLIATVTIRNVFFGFA